MNIRRHKGVGLVEVLVTSLLLGTSLLALTSLQMRSLQFNHSAYLRSQANILAYDILDRLRLYVGKDTKKILDYNVGLAAYDGKTGGANQKQIDINDWRKNIDSFLPQGKGGVECVQNTQVCTVTIEWIDSNDSKVAGENLATFKYITRI